ncbi:hypothetical protein LCGC14_2300270 [marine sediment metagenome]|uniref:Uncharacterized protein n=1 Tax=marine sediment metagenome TaxID=412755 RepID=A0A0F9DB73_9ZZZZ
MPDNARKSLQLPNFDEIKSFPELRLACGEAFDILAKAYRTLVNDGTVAIAGSNKKWRLAVDSTGDLIIEEETSAGVWTPSGWKLKRQ